MKLTCKTFDGSGMVEVIHCKVGSAKVVGKAIIAVELEAADMAQGWDALALELREGIFPRMFGERQRRSALDAETALRSAIAPAPGTSGLHAEVIKRDLKLVLAELDRLRGITHQRESVQEMTDDELVGRAAAKYCDYIIRREMGKPFAGKIIARPGSTLESAKAEWIELRDEIVTRMAMRFSDNVKDQSQD